MRLTVNCTVVLDNQEMHGDILRLIREALEGMVIPAVVHTVTLDHHELTILVGHLNPETTIFDISLFLKL